jgi:hypothetical protein
MTDDGQQVMPKQGELKIRRCVYAKVVNNISQNFNKCDFSPRDMQEYIFMFSIALEWR